MNGARVRAIVEREILEIRKNRLLLLTIFLPPLLLTVLPIALMSFLGGEFGRSNFDSGDVSRFAQLSPELSHLSPGELTQLLILQQFLLFFLLMPLIIPMSVAAFSIIGEKELRSLEPLLATPVRTSELLLGKSIAAVVPAILTTWAAFVVFLIGARSVALSPQVYAGLLDPKWLVAMLVLAPLLSLLSVSIGVVVSSRVNDTRVAQQIGGAIVIPIVLLGVGQTAGLILLNSLTFLIGALVVALIDAGIISVGVRLFDREKILTQWK